MPRTITISDKLAREAADVGIPLEAVELLLEAEIIRRRGQCAENGATPELDEERERLYLRQMKLKYSRIVDEW